MSRRNIIISARLTPEQLAVMQHWHELAHGIPGEALGNSTLLRHFIESYLEQAAEQSPELGRVLHGAAPAEMDESSLLALVQTARSRLR